MREYLCYFEECLRLNFLSCVNITSNLIENKNNDSEDCLLDEENDPAKIFEFVTIPSLLSVISYNTSEPIYFIKKVQKNVVKENLRERFGHEIFSGEGYLKEIYLQKSRSKNIDFKKSSL